jgi:hypothetical protein
VIYRAALALMAWTATAVAAVVAGLAAISALGAGITDRTAKPMTAAQVRDELADPAGSAPSSPTRPPSVTRPPAEAHAKTFASPAGVSRVLDSPGGSVLVRCVGASAYLISWTPQQGYGAYDARRGPADDVSVRFVTGDRRISMVVTCAGGRPTATVHTSAHPRRDDDFHDR